MTMKDDLGEEKDSLIALAISPTIWAAHFLLSYCTAAVWCAKVAGPDGALGAARTAIAAYTAVSLAGIALVGARGWRRHRIGDGSVPHDDDTPEDRHRFLGYATLLLSGLSAVGVVYAALAAVFVGDCR